MTAPVCAVLEGFHSSNTARAGTVPMDGQWRLLATMKTAAFFFGIHAWSISNPALQNLSWLDSPWMEA